jgi:hypothetical protein
MRQEVHLGGAAGLLADGVGANAVIPGVDI